MLNFYDLFKERKLYTCKEALSRTGAPIAGAVSFLGGGCAGFALGVVVVGLMKAGQTGPDSETDVAAAAILGTITTAGGVIFGVPGYVGSYGRINLAMAAYPELGKIESRLLIGPKWSSQVKLFSATVAVLAAPVVIAVLRHGFNTLSSSGPSDAPRLRFK